MRLTDLITERADALRRDLAALEAAADRPLPLPLLARLVTRLQDIRDDLAAEFPTLIPRGTEARR